MEGVVGEVERAIRRAWIELELLNPVQVTEPEFSPAIL